jgi:C4-type Zn-finger protein
MRKVNPKRFCVDVYYCLSCAIRRQNVKLYENNVLRRANLRVKKSEVTRNSVVSAVWALLIIRVI